MGACRHCDARGRADARDCRASCRLAAAGQARHAQPVEAKAPGRPAADPIMAIVSIKSQQVTFYDADGWILRAPVSTGTTERETPAGVFAVVEKNKDHHSSLYGRCLDAEHAAHHLERHRAAWRPPRRATRPRMAACACPTVSPGEGVRQGADGDAGDSSRRTTPSLLLFPIRCCSCPSRMRSAPRRRTPRRLAAKRDEAKGKAAAAAAKTAAAAAKTRGCRSRGGRAQLSRRSRNSRMPSSLTPRRCSRPPGRTGLHGDGRGLAGKKPPPKPRRCRRSSTQPKPTPPRSRTPP